MNMTTVPSNQLKAMQHEIESLKEQVAHLQILERQLDEKDAELKTERIRLAACGVVALANTPDSAAKAREMLPGYRSASCDDVAGTVDREMALRKQLATITAQQAEAIRVKNEALFTAYTTFTEYAQIHSAKQPPDTRKSAFNFDRANQMNAAITIQPSPETLQARDERVAAACANLVNRFISGDGILNDTWVHEIEDEILSGEWRKYL